MVAKNFEVDDLVWAKMKGYSPWPGKIAEPPTNKKPKKHHHYVFFFGSENYAWINDENILLHNDELVKTYVAKKKDKQFIQAVEAIVESSKNDSKYQKMTNDNFEKCISETVPLKFVKNETSFEKHRDVLPKSSSASRMKRKLNDKIKKVEGRNKVKKKRTLSSDHSEAESSTSTRNDDFSNLLHNIPPLLDFNTNDTHRRFEKRSTYVECPEIPVLDLKSENIALKKKNIVATKKKIGFLGLGKLGQGIVKNLIQSGHSVTVFNRTIEKCKDFEEIGAKTAMTPSDVASVSDITFCCVSDTDAVKSLVFGYFGILKGLESCGESKGYVEMTSIDPKTSEAIAQEVRKVGGRYLEAPVNGSRLQAIEGTLCILGAGDESLFNECDSCFKAIASKTIFLNNDVGSASKLNIIRNMLVGTMYAALAEALSLVKRAGLEETEFLNILKVGMLENELLTEKGTAMIEKNYTNNTTLKHVQKDFNLGLLLGNSYSQPTPILAAANEAYKHLRLMRYEDHDVSAVYEGTKR